MKLAVKYIIKIVFVILLIFGIYFTYRVEKIQPLNIPQLLKEWCENTSTIGIAVGLIDNGNIRYYTYGKKDIDSDEPITKKSVFEIGSITKVFTTLLLIDMVNEGMIGLNDPIERYMPDVKIPARNNKKIAFRHLASHTSGLPRLPTNFTIMDPTNPYADYSKEQLYEFLNSYELTRDPGESFEYSNLGVGLLGEVLSLIADKTFEKLVQERIGSKLGMNSTGISLTPLMQKNLAPGHHMFKKTNNWDFKTLQGCGALRSTVEDMTRFLSANMGLIDTTLCQVMKACHIGPFSTSPKNKSTLGWMTIKTTKNGNVIIWHNGKTGGNSSFIGFDPATHRGVVILSNSTDSVDKLGLHLIDPRNYALSCFS